MPASAGRRVTEQVEIRYAGQSELTTRAGRATEEGPPLVCSRRGHMLGICELAPGRPRGSALFW